MFFEQKKQYYILYYMIFDKLENCDENDLNCIVVVNHRFLDHQQSLQFFHMKHLLLCCLLYLE